MTTVVVCEPSGSSILDCCNNTQATSRAWWLVSAHLLVNIILIPVTQEVEAENCKFKADLYNLVRLCLKLKRPEDVAQL